MSYSGSIDLISGIRPKNGGAFPLVNASDVYVDDATRLPEALARKADRSEVAPPAYGTKAQWESKPDFVPAPGQIIIWTDHGKKTGADGREVDVPGFKVGDGNAFNLDLPFVGDDSAERFLAMITEHIGNSSVHVSELDRQRWNNKITTVDSVSGDTLVLTRN